MYARFFALALLLAFGHVAMLEAQLGTAFTYQGQLNQEGLPTDGEFDLEFRLFSDAAGNTPVGGVVAHGDVPTSDGRFTVPLDFGQVFDGNALWLQIRVRPGASTNPGDFVTLSPLQPLTAAPFAHYALGGEGGGDHAHHSLDAEDGNPQDAVFVDAIGRVGIGTTTPTAELHIDGSASASNTSVLVDHPGGATGQVRISSPGGETGVIAIANNGNRRDIRFTDEGISLLTNSAPTIPSLLNGMTIFEDGSVQVGGALPSDTKLYVEQTSSTFVDRRVGIHGRSGSGNCGGVGCIQGVGVLGEATATEGVGVWGNAESASAGIGVYGSGPSRGVQGHTTTSTGYAGIFTGGRNYFQGNVGIGTSDPEFKLDVVGDVRIDGLPTGTSTPLHISATNRLVRSTSSRRYKDNIKPLKPGSSADAFLKLQPVSYNYIESGEPDIGLVAEDVAELIPELVTYDQEGRPEAVKYDKGFLYLLEIVRRQKEELTRRDAIIDEILSRLFVLEQKSGSNLQNVDAPADSISRNVTGGARGTP